jgi:hypothetical protein
MSEGCFSADDGENVGAKLLAAYRYDSACRRLGPTYSKGYIYSAMAFSVFVEMLKS